MSNRTYKIPFWEKALKNTILNVLRLPNCTSAFIIPRISLLVILVCVSTANLKAQDILDNYLQKAAENNAALKASYNRYLADLEKVPQVGALPDPEVSFGYFISPVQTRVGPQEARISAMQMFPWLGTLKSRKNVAVEQAKASYQSVEAMKDELFFNVKSTWYVLFELEQTIITTEKHIKLLRSFEGLATQRFETGNASMVDVLRIQLELEKLENKLQLFQDKKLPLTSIFNRLLNRELAESVLMPDTLEALEFETEILALEDSIEANNNQLLRLRYQQEASKSSVTVAKNEGLPSFGLGLNYIFIGQANGMEVPGNGRDAIMPALTLKLPIYRGKYRARKKEAELRLTALKEEEVHQVKLLHSELHQAFIEYMDAERRVDLFQRQVNKSQQAQDLLLQNYTTAGENFEEVLRMQRIVLDNELEIIRAIKDNNTAIAKIISLL